MNMQFGGLLSVAPKCWRQRTKATRSQFPMETQILSPVLKLSTPRKSVSIGASLHLCCLWRSPPWHSVVMHGNRCDNYCELVIANCSPLPDVAVSYSTFL